MTEPDRTDIPSLISPDEFAIVAQMLKQKTGIHIEPNKRAMVSGRLAKRLKALDLKSIAAYREFLNQPENDGEEDAFISALTTNMTRFNREDHHFEHMCARILPTLAKAAQIGKRVRLWSAGCSTGEEAYDLAFRMLDACPNAPKLDVRILATDIDKIALKAAREGTYSASCLSDFPSDYADRYFDRDSGSSGMVRVAQEPRELITFRCLNLNAEWPFKGKFDVIMCRNVTIYFDPETQARLWSRLADRVQPHGALYVGHSELLPEHIADLFTQEERGAFCRPGQIAPSGISQSTVSNGAL